MGVVRKQGISNTILVYIGTLIGFVSLVFIQPRFLTKEELGLTRLILSFGSVLSILFSLGISAVTIRYLPRTLDPGTRHRGFFGFLLLYTSGAVIVGSVVLGIVKGPLLRYYGDGAGPFQENFPYVILLTVILSFVLGFNAYCIALMRTTVTTVLNDIVVRLLLIAIIGVHFAGFMDLQGFLLAFCLIYAVQALALLIAIFRADRPGLIPDIHHIRTSIGLRPIVRYGLIITLTAMNSVTLKYVDTMFVGTISIELVAVYSVAAFLGLAVEIPLNALERVANPVVAHALAKNDMEAIRTVYHDSSRALLLIGGWLFLLISLSASDLFSLLPPGYAHGVHVTQIIAFGALINMGTGVNYPILANSHKYIWGSVFLVLLLVLTLVGNVLLIPHIGMYGPAVAGCLASIVFNALKFDFIRRHFGMQPFDRSTVKHLAIVAGVFVLGFFLPMPGPPWLTIALRTLLISLIYAASTLMLRTSTDLFKYLPASLRNRWTILR